MNFKKWFGGGRERMPETKVRLGLFAFEERLVPDATAPIPPDQPPGQTGDPSPQTYTFDLQAGDTVLLMKDGTNSVYYSVAASGGAWIESYNSATGAYSAQLLNPSAVTTPDFSADLAIASDFVPDSTLSTTVWDPNTLTLFTVPPGTDFGGAVDGYSTVAGNFVLLQDDQTTSLPPPPDSTVVQSSGPNVHISPDAKTVTVTYPDGRSVTIIQNEDGSIDIKFGTPPGPPNIPTIPPPDTSDIPSIPTIEDRKDLPPIEIPPFEWREGVTNPFPTSPPLPPDVIPIIK